MDIMTYRKSLPQKSTRIAFCHWINERLAGHGLRISVSYLRDLESGRVIPSLPLAIAVEDVSGGVISVRDWYGLSKRRLQNLKIPKGDHSGRSIV